jgi:HD-GYP domain-containing protein (c-di-GMP phosphodiesterase class II)
MDTVISYLTTHPFFYSLGAKDILAFSSYVRIEHYEPDSVMIRQGDIGESIYMIVEGHVCITMVDEEGRDIAIAHRGVGEILGEMAIMKKDIRMATIKAMDEVKVLRIEGDAFRNLLSLFPDVRDKMQRLISQRSALIDFYETDYEKMYKKKRMLSNFEMDPGLPYLLIQLNDASGGAAQLEHCKEVAFLSRELSRILCPAMSELIYLGGLLHEIGKLALNDSLAVKARKRQFLFPGEKARVDKIYDNALEILRPDDIFSEQISFIKFLNKDDYREMPLEAQILKVANDYLEMIDKNYQGLPKNKALQVLRAGSDTLYNPRIIKALEEVFDKFHSLRINNQINFIRMINIALDAKDNMTLEHSQATVTLSQMLGKKIGLTREQLEELKLGCELQNVGTIYVPHEIVNAPRKITDDEFSMIKQHPVYSAAFFQNVTGMEQFVTFILHHHERMDGKGYPHGLSGDQIPLFSRIIRIVDVYNALRKPRIYRRNKKGEPIVYRPLMALTIMGQMQGVFDPELLAIFKDMLKRGELKSYSDEL